MFAGCILGTKAILINYVEPYGRKKIIELIMNDIHKKISIHQSQIQATSKSVSNFSNPTTQINSSLASLVVTYLSKRAVRFRTVLEFASVHLLLVLFLQRI